MQAPRFTGMDAGLELFPACPCLMSQAQGPPGLCRGCVVAVSLTAPALHHPRTREPASGDANRVQDCPSDSPVIPPSFTHDKLKEFP